MIKHQQNFFARWKKWWDRPQLSFIWRSVDIQIANLYVVKQQSNTVFSFIVLLQELNKIKILTCLNTEREDLRIVVYRPMQSTCVRISLEMCMK